MIILGINDSHNASACLLIEGKLVAAIQEERLRRVKNWSGFPFQSVCWVLNYSGVLPKEVDRIAFLGYSYEAPAILGKLRKAFQLTRLPFFPTIWKWLRLPALYTLAARPLRQRQRRRNLQLLGLPSERACFVEHHLAHAASAYYGWGKMNVPVLVLTADGSGDGVCATVNIGKDGNLTRLETVNTSASLGILYTLVTLALGMTPLEHEAKVMGLAPYAHAFPATDIKLKLRKQFEFTGKGKLSWRRMGGASDIRVSYPSIQKLLEEYRFDAVAGGVQAFVEEWLCEWVSHCVQATGIRQVALAGGVFMNVKANLAISKLDCVDDLFIFPSCGDETGAMGAAWQTYCKLTNQRPEPLQHLYLGPEFGEEEVGSALRKNSNAQGFTIKQVKNPAKTLAKLIAAGEIVAYFGGRMEFGARALGNRSIFADPRKPESVRAINELIKCRDFWMPFAPAISYSHAGRYLINPKSLEAPYMILGFETTASRTEIVSAIHPWDYTARPQIVTPDRNPFLFRVIEEFEKLTGCGAVLNTSFNLHGEPIVMSPDDALDIFHRSGLRHLVIGSSLVQKSETIPPPHDA